MICILLLLLLFIVFIHLNRIRTIINVQNSAFSDTVLIIYQNIIDVSIMMLYLPLIYPQSCLANEKFLNLHKNILENV